MNTSDLVRRTDELIELGNKLLSGYTGTASVKTVTPDAIREFRRKTASFIADVHGCSPSIPNEIEPPETGMTLRDAEREMAALRAFREEIRYAGEFGH